jgi:hypothetical protein
MSRSRRIIKFLKGNVIACLALFVALSGTAYAGNTIFSADIVDGEVKSVDIGDGEVQSIDVANNNLGGSDVADGSLTGSDVATNSLTGTDITGLGGADVTNESLTGADVTGLTGSDVAANSLTGSDIDESSLSMQALGCQTGKILGFARVKGTAGIPTFYTNAGAAVDITNNCSGGTVEVRRAGPGLYFVRFVGNPAALALAVSNSDGTGTNSVHDDNIVSVAKVSSGSDAGAFRVEVEDVDPDSSDGTDPQDGQFTIMLP